MSDRNGYSIAVSRLATRWRRFLRDDVSAIILEQVFLVFFLCLMVLGTGLILYIWLTEMAERFSQALKLVG